MNKEIFVYDKNYNEYVAKINNIEFQIQSLPNEKEWTYIRDIAENYSKKLYSIARFMLQDKNFKRFFDCDKMLEQGLIYKLNIPIIRIINEKEATISYCNHTLDNIHIISFEFIGVFDKLAYLSIDG